MISPAPISFACIPVCKSCRETQSCLKAIAVPAGESLRARESADPHAGTIVLPCGCWGLPWPVVHTLGAPPEIYCERHGWMKITPAKRKKMQMEAQRRAVGYVQATLPDEPPY